MFKKIAYVTIMFNLLSSCCVAFPGGLGIVQEEIPKNSLKTKLPKEIYYVTERTNFMGDSKYWTINFYGETINILSFKCSNKFEPYLIYSGYGTPSCVVCEYPN